MGDGVRKVGAREGFIERGRGNLAGGKRDPRRALKESRSEMERERQRMITWAIACVTAERTEKASADRGREETPETWSMDIKFTRVPFSCAGRWQNIWLQCQQLHTSLQNLPTGHTEPRARPRSLEMHGTTLR